jgi:hypothetical protein
VDERRAAGVKLLAKITHVGFDDVLITVKVVVPHVVNDLILREDSSRIEEKYSKEIELSGGELNECIATPYFVTLLVHHNVGESKARIVLCGLMAPKDGFYPRDDLG